MHRGARAEALLLRHQAGVEHLAGLFGGDAETEVTLVRVSAFDQLAQQQAQRMALPAGKSLR